MTTPRCTACNHQSDQPVCHDCRADTRRNLYRVPTLLTDLAHHAAARNTGTTSPIGRAGFGGQPPANLQALTLTLGPTGPVLHRVHTHPNPDTPGQALPSIPTWITTWAAVWRDREGHHPPPARQVRVLWEIRDHKPTAALAATFDNLDILANDWHTRFGQPHTSRTTHIDLKYLTVRFDTAADHYPDTGLFVRQLGRLVGTASATAGEPNQAVYLGDCPEPIIDQHTGVQAVTEDGTERWCGARIVYRPDRDGKQVTCPWCHTATPERSWFHLAYRMRMVWGRVGDRDAWQR